MTTPTSMMCHKKSIWTDLLSPSVHIAMFSTPIRHRRDVRRRPKIAPAGRGRVKASLRNPTQLISIPRLPLSAEETPSAANGRLASVRAAEEAILVATEGTVPVLGVMTVPLSLSFLTMPPKRSPKAPGKRTAPKRKPKAAPAEGDTAEDEPTGSKR
ncbi:hypothetical protein BCR39DRAFT_508465 [Naematelia encephala]|uniref:Uncharacterized protein n=1 Tax=Naematelia encephala TaxID=71784 RepID=A0A1Y2AF02_9TREE|nr:hypothetical protein BCR39DRAFT_508465 [Naematelia encephala]